jgi:hypothetical protein
MLRYASIIKYHHESSYYDLLIRITQGFVACFVGTTTLAITTFNITTLGIMAFSITINETRHLAQWNSLQIVVILSITKKHYSECHYAECHYTGCRGAILPHPQQQIRLVLQDWDQGASTVKRFTVVIKLHLCKPVRLTLQQLLPTSDIYGQGQEPTLVKGFPKDLHTGRPCHACNTF